MSDEETVSIETLLSHREWVIRVARSLAPGAAGDDLAQGVWLRAMAKPPRHDRGLAAWFLTLLRRGARDAWREENRRRAREERVARPEVTPDGADLVARADTHRRVVNAVMDLPEPLRSTVLMRNFEDLGPSAIAARQGISPETVRTRLKRANALLRERLAREHGGDRDLALAIRALAGAGAGGALVSTKAKLLAAAALLILAAASAPLFLSGAAPENRPAPAPSAPAPIPVEPVLAARAPDPEPEQEPLVFREAPAPATAPKGPSGATIAVRVVDPTGTGIAEAEVSLVRPPERAVLEWSPYDPGDGQKLASAKTDAAGGASFPGLEPGAYSAIAGAPGRATVVAGVRVRRPDGTVDLRLLLSAARTLTGTVRRPDGRPVPGLFLLAGAARTETDARGAYRLTGLPPARIRLRARPTPRCFFELGWVDAANVSRFDAVLDDSAAVAGRVTDGRTGRPVAGARVRMSASSADRIEGRFSAWTETDGNGDFQFAGVPALGFGGLEVVAEGWLPSIVRGEPGVTPLLSGRTFRQDVELSRGAVVRGRVTIGEDEPAAGATVKLYGRLWPWPIPSPFEATTGPDGRYEFPAVPPGPATFAVAADGGWLPGYDGASATWRSEEHPTGIVVPAEGALVKDLVLRRGVVVEGLVRDPEGHPVSGVEVVVHPCGSFGRCFTDEAGRFRLAGIDPGEGRVVRAVRVPGAVLLRFEDQPVSAPFTVPPDRPVTGVLLTVGAGATFAGRVVGPEGEPVPGASLRLTGTLGRYAGEQWESLNAGPDVPVGPEGSFCVEHVYAPAVGVFASAPGFGETVLPEVPVDGRQVEVRLPAERRLGGRVVDGKGTAVAGAELRLVPLAGGRFSRAGPIRAVSGPDGSFAIGGLGDLRMTLTVSAPGFADAALVVEGSADDLEIVLGPGERIEGIVVDGETGRPIAGVPVVARPVRPDPTLPSGPVRDRTDASGRFRLLRLTRDRFELSLNSERDARPGDPPYAAVDGLEVPSGTTDLRIALAPGLEISGRVTDEAGRPVPEVDVSIRGRVGFGERDPAHYHRAVTGVDGRFRLARLPRRPYELRFSHGPSRGRTGEGFVDLRIEGVRPGGEPLAVVLRRGTAITGRVVSDVGEMPAGGVLQFAPAGSDDWRRARIEADGSFRTPLLDPSGVYDFRADFEGYAITCVRGVAGSARDVVVRVRRDAGPAIEGRVLCEDGTPAAGARVAAYPLNPSRDVRARYGETGADGRFRIDGLADGDYRVSVPSPQDFTSLAARTVRAGATDVALTVRRLCRVTLRLVDGEGRPVRGGIAWRQDRPGGGHSSGSGQTDDEGRFEIRGLRPGTVKLTAYAKDRQDLGEFPVPSADLRLVLR